MAKPIEDNRLRKISTTNSVPNWTNEIYSANPDVNTNELLIEHAKKVAIERKQFHLLPSRPCTEEFAGDNVLVRTTPPFERVHETKQDVDWRVVGHGFMMRIRCFSPETNNLFNSKMDESDGKTFLPFRFIAQKLKNNETVGWDYCSNWENWKILEGDRLLFKDENEPYETQQSPEFVARQQAELQAYRIQAQHERIAREQKQERIRLLAIQRLREKSEKEAREEIEKAEQLEKQNQESQLNSIGSTSDENSEVSSSLNEN
jgi:hypothetical protein